MRQSRPIKRLVTGTLVGTASRAKKAPPTLRSSAGLLVVGAIALLVFTGPAAATYPGSNDGRLAFAATVDSNTDIYSVLPSGDAPRRLTDDPGMDACPAYSADGKTIAWCHQTGTSEPFEIWTMKQNGTRKQQVTNLGGSANFPDFSPDGNRILFQFKAPAPSRQQLWVVNRDGSDPHLLAASAGNDRLGAFSPDGNRIAFISDRSGLPQLWLMNADGSGQTQLTFDAVPKDQLPDWSPDGTRIAFVERTAPTGGNVWLIDANGSDAHPITTAADDLGTAWSPDGTKIAYLNWASRTVELMDADGTDAHPVYPLGIQFVPGWQPRGDRSGDLG